jgi:hypothetical protein
VPVRAGDVIKVPEAAYRYGQGQLRLQVVRAGQPFRDKGQLWVRVAGHRLLLHDRADPRLMEVDVLVSALATHES